MKDSSPLGTISRRVAVVDWREFLIWSRNSWNRGWAWNSARLSSCFWSDWRSCWEREDILLWWLRLELESVEVFEATEGLNFLNHRDEVEAGGGEDFGVGSEDADEFLEGLGDVVLLAGKGSVIHEVVFIADEESGVHGVEEFPDWKGFSRTEDFLECFEGKVLAAVEEHLSALWSHGIHPDGGGNEFHSGSGTRVGCSVLGCGTATTGGLAHGVFVHTSGDLGEALNGFRVLEMGGGDINCAELLDELVHAETGRVLLHHDVFLTAGQGGDINEGGVDDETTLDVLSNRGDAGVEKPSDNLLHGGDH